MNEEGYIEIDKAKQAMINKKIKQFEQSVMDDASTSLLANEAYKTFGDMQDHRFVFEPTIEGKIKLTCIKNDFNLDWQTTIKAHNIFNKDVAKKGNCLVSKITIKKQISDSWNIEVTGEVRL